MREMPANRVLGDVLCAPFWSIGGGIKAGKRFQFGDQYLRLSVEDRIVAGCAWTPRQIWDGNWQRDVEPALQLPGKGF